MVVQFLTDEAMSVIFYSLFMGTFLIHSPGPIFPVNVAEPQMRKGGTWSRMIQLTAIPNDQVFFSSMTPFLICIHHPKL